MVLIPFGKDSVSGQSRYANSGEALEDESGGGVGNLALVEKKEILAAVTTVTFSGLDGDADGIYVLESHIVPTGAGVTNYFMNPNTLTTGQGGNLVDLGGAYSQSALTRFQFSLTDAGAGAIGSAFSTTKLWARAAGPGATGLRRRMLSYAQVGGRQITAAANWSDVATNITSLEIEASVASQIGIGSTLTLYKLTS
jgi:hypothetical protein